MLVLQKSILEQLAEWLKNPGYGRFIIHAVDNHISHAEIVIIVKEGKLPDPQVGSGR